MWGQTRLSAGEKAWGPLSDRQHCQLGKLIHQPSIPVSIQSALVHWLLMTLITIENKMMDKLIPKQSRKDEEWSPLQKGGKVYIVIIAYTFIVIIGKLVTQGAWDRDMIAPGHLPTSYSNCCAWCVAVWHTYLNSWSTFFLHTQNLRWYHLKLPLTAKAKMSDFFIKVGYEWSVGSGC